ncbi:MAG: hypothetical protein R3E39_02535 [Anaerolineae bacterium]
MQRYLRPVVGLTSFFMLALLVLAISLPLNSTALAQGVPTATPNDPIWRGFSAVRDAIEEARSVDLTLVKAWEFEESEWNDGGLDGCRELEDITSYRPIYFGWTYTITSLRGDVYQARISYDLKQLAICDKVVTTTTPVVAAGTPDPNLPPPVAGSAAVGGFELRWSCA